MFAKARVAALEVQMQELVRLCHKLTERVAAVEQGRTPSTPPFTMPHTLSRSMQGVPGGDLSSLLFPFGMAVVRYTDANSFPVGTRVRINSKDGRASWPGNIIDRPANCREFGIRGPEAGPLVWLVSDHGRVYGIYPANVRRAQ